MDFKLFARQQENAVNLTKTKVLGNPQNKTFRGKSPKKSKELPNNKIHSDQQYINNGSNNQDQYYQEQEQEQDHGQNQQGNAYYQDANYYQDKDYYEGNIQDQPYYANNMYQPYEDQYNYDNRGAGPDQGYYQQQTHDRYDQGGYQTDWGDQQFDQGGYQNGGYYYQDGYNQYYQVDQYQAYQGEGGQFYDNQDPYAANQQYYGNYGSIDSTRQYKGQGQQMAGYGRREDEDFYLFNNNPNQYNGDFAGYGVAASPGKQGYKQQGNKKSKLKNKFYEDFEEEIGVDGHRPVIHSSAPIISASKNLIQDISAFSKSEKSIQVKKQKNLSKQKEDQLSNASQDPEKNKTTLRSDEKKLTRTKSQDDLKLSVKSGALLAEFPTLNKSSKKGEKNINSIADQLIPSKDKFNTFNSNNTKANNNQNAPPILNNLYVQTSSKQSPNQKKSQSNAIGSKPQQSPPAPVQTPNPPQKDTRKNKDNPYNNEEKFKTDKQAKYSKDNNNMQRRDYQEEARYQNISQKPYNREELISQVVQLINSSKIDQTNVSLFKKFDEELGFYVDYVRIDLPIEQSNNDHIISYKPVLPNKDGGEMKKKTGENYNRYRNNYEDNNAGYRESDGYAAGKKNQGYQTPNVNLPTNLNNLSDQKVYPSIQHKPNINTGISSQLQTTNLANEQQASENNHSIVEQAMHKTLTGKLQRHIKKLSDDEKAAVFKQLKPSLSELLLDQYGRYVIVLLLKTNIISVVDALIAHFNKQFNELLSNKHGHLFCQNLLELKFKDVRLRRILKKIDQSLKPLMEDYNSAQIVLAYVTQLPPNEMQDFIEYCQKDPRVCIENSTACKIFAKVYGKVTDLDRLAIEMQLKNIMPQVFNGGYGKELVEIFIVKADIQNLQPLAKKLYDDLPRYLSSEDFEYFFLKVTEIKRQEVIEETISRVFLNNTLDDQSVLSLINNEIANKNILNFFTLASLVIKNKMGAKLKALQTSKGTGINSIGNKLLTFCNDYFSNAVASR